VTHWLQIISRKRGCLPSQTSRSGCHPLMKVRHCGRGCGRLVPWRLLGVGDGDDRKRILIIIWGCSCPLAMVRW
jgi:hypothetical protein